jgi:tRNA pseudouridine38-40 synthase
VSNLTSLKMEVPDESWNSYGRIEVMKTRINSFLPDDIRVNGVCRMPKRFEARSGVVARDYEYIIPLDSHPLLQQLDLAKLRKSFAQLEGIHSFHNFTSAKEAMTLKNNKVCLPSGQDSAVTADVNKRLLRNMYYIKLHNQIYTCAETKMPYIKIEVFGQSFLLHQIRIMVAAALASALDIVEPSFIPAALRLPIRVNVPMVPGEGLLLNGMTIDPKYECVLNPTMADPFSKFDTMVLSPKEYSECNEFKERVIYPEIFSSSSVGMTAPLPFV